MFKAEKKDPVEREKLEMLARKEIDWGEVLVKGDRGRYQSHSL